MTPNCDFDWQTIDNFIRSALKEDIRTGDITTAATISRQAKSHAIILAKQNGILAGCEIASRVFSLLNNSMAFHFPMQDGDAITPQMQVLEIRGSTSAILKAERTALNLMARMSGIATFTRLYVDEISSTKAKILDTRKTIPGLRYFDKLAVSMGGAVNHRYALDDMYLIKENHISSAGSIKKAIEKCNAHRTKNGFTCKIVVEASTEDEAVIAARSSADRILLDNMTLELVAKLVSDLGSSIDLEVSGGITLKNIREYAETGVHFISVGALTHSAPSFDFSLLLA